jgi:hypothetical protein
MTTRRHPALSRSILFGSLLAALTFSLASCAADAARSTHDSSAVDPGAAKKDAPPAKEDDEKPDKKEKVEKKEHELACARLELQVAKQSTAADEREAHMRVVEAERKLDMAKRDQENYKNVESVLANAEASLHLDEAKERLEEARQELTELEKTYAKEKFAEITKELVLTRGKVRVHLAEKSLDLAQKKLAEQRDVDQPKKLAELSLALEKAQHEANEARAKEERGQTESKLKLMKAEQSVQELEHALAKLQSSSDEKAAKS